MMPTASEKLRVVIDTNVFVSGLNYPGTPNQVLVRFIRGEMALYISPFILGELERILTEKLRWSSQRTQATLNLIRAKAILVDPKSTVSVVTRKDDDNRILECGLDAQAQYIVTGDRKDLLPLKHFQGIQLVSPAEFLGVLGTSERP